MGEIGTFLGAHPQLAVMAVVWLAVVAPLTVVALVARPSPEGRFDWRQGAALAWAAFTLGGVLIWLRAPWYLVLTAVAYIAALILIPGQVRKRGWTGGRATMARMAPSLLVALVFLPWLLNMAWGSWEIWRSERESEARSAAYVESGQWDGAPRTVDKVKARVLRIEQLAQGQTWTPNPENPDCDRLALRDRAWTVCKDGEQFPDRVVVQALTATAGRQATDLANARRLLWVMTDAPHDAEAAVLAKTGKVVVEGLNLVRLEASSQPAAIVATPHFELN